VTHATAAQFTFSAPDSRSMSGDAELPDRVAQLERELRELHLRVAALERLVGTAGEHPADRTTVQKKVSYDWQS
jgi:hypothetical protein